MLAHLSCTTKWKVWRGNICFVSLLIVVTEFKFYCCVSSGKNGEWTDPGPHRVTGKSDIGIIKGPIRWGRERWMAVWKGEEGIEVWRLFVMTSSVRIMVACLVGAYLAHYSVGGTDNLEAANLRGWLSSSASLHTRPPPPLGPTSVKVGGEDKGGECWHCRCEKSGIKAKSSCRPSSSSTTTTTTTTTTTSSF